MARRDAVPRAKESRLEQQRQKRRALRKNRNYDGETCREQDAIRNRNKYTKESERLQNNTLRLYKEFLTEEKDWPEGEDLQMGQPAPDLVTVKEFLRWYIHSTKGRISNEPIVSTVSNQAERLFAGLKRVTGSEIMKEDRKEVFHWITYTLTEEGLIRKVEPQRFLFIRQDFIRLMSSFWTEDDPVFIHGRMKVQITFALQIYLFTGARIGAFIPPAHLKAERGLLYEHIQLVLFRAAGVRWKIGWRVDQHWVKNNRNAEYTVFGTAIRDHDRPQFASALNLLALAFADNALFGFNSPEDLDEQEIPEGQNELPLRWKDDAKKRRILRNVTADGVTEDALTEDRFNYFLRAILRNAGYYKGASVHAIRRALGKKVNSRYTEAEVAQILTQKDTKVYGQKYVAHCSSVDPVGAMLDEVAETSHIEYFQGFSQFHERGLPCKLPAEEEDRVLQNPELLEMDAEIQRLIKNNADHDSINEARVRYRVTLTRLRVATLERYQTEWVQKRRDWKVLTRGKQQAKYFEKTDCIRALSQIMPELGRLAAVMSSEETLPFEQKLLFTRDLLRQCTRNFEVIYRPGEEPIDGRCPAKGCGIVVESLPGPQRSNHIHACVRRELAGSLGQPESELEYCYECFNWFHDASEWEQHCRNHIESIRSLRCELITYRHTLIRPAYCPWCLGNETAPASRRMQYWKRSNELRDHIEDKHIQVTRWPAPCPHPLCDHILENETACRRHLHDMHSLQNSIWKLPAKRREGRKTHTSPDGIKGYRKCTTGIPQGPKRRLSTSSDGAETECRKRIRLITWQAPPLQSPQLTSHLKPGPMCFIQWPTTKLNPADTPLTSISGITSEPDLTDASTLSSASTLMDGSAEATPVDPRIL